MVLRAQVSNAQSGEVRLLPLEAACYAFGTSPPEDVGRVVVTLHGRFISDLQFLLRRDPDGWMVVHFGVNPTMLDGVALRQGVPHAVSAGQVIVADVERVELQAQTELEPVRSQSDDIAAAWLGLQEEVHERLRDTLPVAAEWERKTSTQPGGVPQEILFVLDRIVHERLRSVGDHMLMHAVRECVRQRVMRNIALGGQPGGPEAAYRRPPAVLETLTQRVQRDMGLTLRPLDLEDDIARAEAWLAAPIGRLRHAVSGHERLELASFLLRRSIGDLIAALGPITDLMEQDLVTEIMVARHDAIYVERAISRVSGTERVLNAFTSPKQLRTMIQRLASTARREISDSTPIVDFRLPDGSRVNAVLDRLAPRGDCMTIRKFPRQHRLTLDDLVPQAMTAGMRDFLVACVAIRRNILVSGGTGSGKTTLLNALVGLVSHRQRIITIEDTAELYLGDRHVVSLISSPATVEGLTAVTIRDLLRSSLRMRPDRIIIGECRDGAAADMLQALNTGHAGSMTTAHANTPTDLMLRLESLVIQGEPSMPVSAIRQQIASAVDIVVQLSRVEGRRVITEISEVVGLDPNDGSIVVEPIFVNDGRGGDVAPARRFTGYLPSFVAELVSLDRPETLSMFDT